VADATATALDEQRPDLVHVMNVTCWPALAEAARREIPTVLSVHALELQHSDLIDAALEYTDIVHSVSFFSASLFRSDHAAEVPVRTVHPMFDIGPFQSVSPQSERAPVVLCLSRLVDRKNVATLLTAWERLSESLRDEWTLRIAGTGPDDDLAEEYAAEYPSVEYLGYISEERKRREYAAADLFALPATRSGYDAEGFGIVYLEAQAAGTPTLGSRTGGVPEAVGDGGVLVDDERDPEMVAETLRVLLDDDDHRERLATQAAERARRFDIESGTDEYLALYRTVLVAPGRSEDESNEAGTWGEAQ
jgi:phosphatidylinositol alpha-1,6-mannosyltransferase